MTMANLGLEDVDVDSLLKVPPRAKNVRKPTKSKPAHDIVANPMPFGKHLSSVAANCVVTVFPIFLKISLAAEDLGSFAQFGAPGDSFRFPPVLPMPSVQRITRYLTLVFVSQTGQFEVAPSALETKLFDVKEFELKDGDD